MNELPKTETTRRPWKKPTLQRLSVALDTASGSGSNLDGNSGSIL